MIDAPAQKSVAVHSDASPCHASAAIADAARHLDQESRVCVRSAQCANGGLVACLFRFCSQHTLEPPCARVKPEQTAIDMRQQIDQWVAPTNMRHLVREDGA